MRAIANTFIRHTTFISTFVLVESNMYVCASVEPDQMRILAEVRM